MNYSKNILLFTQDHIYNYNINSLLQIYIIIKLKEVEKMKQALESFQDQIESLK